MSRMGAFRCFAVLSLLLPVLAGLVVLDSTQAQTKDEKPVLIVGPEKAEVVKGWVKNSIGMKLACIPKGKFTMGSPRQEQDAAVADYEKTEKKKASDDLRDWYRSEGPQHEVEITKEFWLGVHEVTQGQFKKVMGYNPSCFSTDGEGKSGLEYGNVRKPAGGKETVAGKDTSDFPVENVSYEEAEEFCKKLTALAAEKRRGRTYRLPTEAEWEYACRGGADSSKTFHSGDSLSSSQANFDGNRPFGGAAKSECLERTCAVGSYKPNAFGLYDMHGNVREWCADWYGADYYGNSPRRDPPGPSKGSCRVIRGGGCYCDGRHCRSANRNHYYPLDRLRTLGFRVVLAASRHGVD